MKQFYLLLLLLASTATGQTLAPDSSTRHLPLADTTALPATGIPVRALVNIQTQLSQVAGVQVTPFSGEPGALNVVRIRGLTGLNEQSHPLVVLDGLPMLNTDIAPQNQRPVRATLFSFTDEPLVDGPGASPLLGIPVADIATVEVLKGAAATARYGAQGGYGVLLITTRRGGAAGERQPLQLSYEGFGGVQQVRQRYDLLDARQQATLSNELNQQFGFRPDYTAAQVEAFGKGSDGQQEVFRVAQLQSHNVSAQGSTGHTRYYASANYLRQTGVVRGTALNRYGLRAGVEHQLGRRLRVFGRLGLSQIDRSRPVVGLVSLAVQALPLVPLRDPDGGYFSGNADFNANLPGNPLAVAELTGRTERTRRLLGQAGLCWQVAPALALTVQAGYERSVLQGTGADFVYAQGQTQPYSATFLGQGREAYTRTDEARLDYVRPARSRHGLEASLAYLTQYFETVSRDSSVGPSTGSSSFPINVNGSVVKRRQGVGSVMAHVRYSYNGRYELLASLRTDDPGSFRPGGGIATYWYGGAEACWHAGQTRAVAGHLGLSALDLRAGLGQTSTLLLGQFTPFVLGNYTGPQPNADRTTQLDASLHLGWLQNRLHLTLAAYQRRTENAHILLPVPALGGSPPLDIATTVLNRGLELTLAADWQRGRLRGHTTVAAALNRHRIESVSNVSAFLYFANRLTAGEAINSFFLANYQGPDPTNGQARYATTTYDNGFGGTATATSQRYQGNGLPKALLNLSQQLRYGAWELNAQFDALLGYDLLNVDQADLDNPSYYHRNSTLVLDRWMPDHRATNVPAASYLTSHNGPLLSDANLSSGDHLRLTQLTLGYDFRAATAHPITVWAGGRNLFVLTHYRGFDPNVSSGGSAPLLAGYDNGAYPVARTWLLGVRASF